MKEHTPEEIKYRLSDLGVQIGKIALDYIAELEKENAELKEYNKYLRRKRQGGIQKQYNKVSIIKQQKEQLIKAKEIIKKFLLWENVWYSKTESKYELLKEAEDFLDEKNLFLTNKKVSRFKS